MIKQMPQEFRDALETFENQFPQRDYDIEIVCPEFTSVCPKTGQPDFGTLTVRYLPSDGCIELKSLKYYLTSFRNVGIYQEHAANRVLEDLVGCCAPRWMEIETRWRGRGGIRSIIKARHDA
mgnify:CR=1 FL=1